MVSGLPSEVFASAFELLCYFFTAGAAAITFLMSQR